VRQDTSDSEVVHYHRLLAAMSPRQRVAATVSLCNAVRTAAIAGLRHRHPKAPEAELRVRLMVRLYGRAEATRVFGAVPDDAV
jgi:hypothetical protein